MRTLRADAGLGVGRGRRAVAAAALRLLEGGARRPAVGAARAARRAVVDLGADGGQRARPGGGAAVPRRGRRRPGPVPVRFGGHGQDAARLHGAERVVEFGRAVGGVRARADAALPAPAAPGGRGDGDVRPAGGGAAAGARRPGGGAGRGHGLHAADAADALRGAARRREADGVDLEQDARRGGRVHGGRPAGEPDRRALPGGGAGGAGLAAAGAGAGALAGARGGRRAGRGRVRTEGRTR